MFFCIFKNCDLPGTFLSHVFTCSKNAISESLLLTCFFNMFKKNDVRVAYFSFFLHFGSSDSYICFPYFLKNVNFKSDVFSPSFPWKKCKIMQHLKVAHFSCVVLCSCFNYLIGYRLWLLGFFR